VGELFPLVPAHPGCPGQNPDSHKTVVCVCVCVCVCEKLGTQASAKQHYTSCISTVMQLDGRITRMHFKLKICFTVTQSK